MTSESEPRTHRRDALLRGAGKGITGVRWMGDATVATADGGGSVRLWDAGTGAQVFVARGEGTRIFALAYSAARSILATADATGTVALWKRGRDTPLRTYAGHEGHVYDVAFSSDGRRLASAGADGTVLVWR